METPWLSRRGSQGHSAWQRGLYRLEPPPLVAHRQRLVPLHVSPHAGNGTRICPSAARLPSKVAACISIRIGVSDPVTRRETRAKRTGHSRNQGRFFRVGKIVPLAAPPDRNHASGAGAELVWHDREGSPGGRVREIQRAARVPTVWFPGSRSSRKRPGPRRCHRFPELCHAIYSLRGGRPHGSRTGFLYPLRTPIPFDR